MADGQQCPGMAVLGSLRECFGAFSVCFGLVRAAEVGNRGWGWMLGFEVAGLVLGPFSC